MPNPQEIILSTEFWDTLKNDDFNPSIQVVIPSGVSVPGSGIYRNTKSVNLGSPQSIAETRVETSRNPSKDYVVSSPYSAGDTVGVNGFSRVGSLGSYQIYCSAIHTSPTAVTVEVLIVNPYGSTLTGQSGDETFTFKVRTYRAPFPT